MIRSKFTNTFTGGTLEKIIENFESAYINDDGVVLWRSNDCPPFEDMLVDFAEAGLISFVNVRKSIAVREEQSRKAIDAYIKGRENRTEEQKVEELFEMRAAFGKSEKVVDAITGEVTHL